MNMYLLRSVWRSKDNPSAGRHLLPCWRRGILFSCMEYRVSRPWSSQRLPWLCFSSPRRNAGVSDSCTMCPVFLYCWTSSLSWLVLGLGSHLHNKLFYPVTIFPVYMFLTLASIPASVTITDTCNKLVKRNPLFCFTISWPSILHWLTWCFGAKQRMVADSM